VRPSGFRDKAIHSSLAVRSWRLVAVPDAPPHGEQGGGGRIAFEHPMDGIARAGPAGEGK